jgi:hypothetical protein
MEAVLASLIAVLGTLLGSGVTHLAQRRSDERTERFTHAERLRQERIDAYCAYAGTLLSYRRLLVLRWFVVHEDRPDENTPALQEEIYKTRYAAQEAMFRAQMLTDDPALIALAERVMESVTELHHVTTRDQLDVHRDTSRQHIRDFIATATPHTR